MSNDYRIRESRAGQNLWGGYRDEMVATAMTLSLLTVGGFLLADKMLFAKRDKVDPNQAVIEYQPQTLGASDPMPGKIDLLPSPTASTQTAQASEGAVVAPEVPFGDDGDYDFSAYRIKFLNPRLIFDAKTNTKRKLVIQVELINKSVLEGLDTRITASIIKDGKVIVPKAALYVPNRQMVGPNQEAVFQAELNLVEATDVRELRYEPGGDLPTASHFLYQ